MKRAVDNLTIEAVRLHLEHWCRGRLYAHKKREISRSLGITTRAVELAINALRNIPIPICSDSGGYWLPSSASDMDHTLASMRHRIGEMHRTLARQESAREVLLRKETVEPSGQVRLFAAGRTP